MNVIAVDDERIALELLGSSILKYDSNLSVHMFRDPMAALEYAKVEKCDIAFLDINMYQMSGIALAQELQRTNPDINLIFTTGYSEYAMDAFNIHASGYVTKPITPAKIAKELENLRNPIEAKEVVSDKPVVRCFGNFEIFVDGEPVHFSYGRTKEMLAYLVDRRGANCTTQEIMSVLWEEGNHASYLRNIKKDLVDKLDKLGCGEMIINSHGKMAVHMGMFECDYYDYLSDKNVSKYNGEYMSQYSWAEVTNAWLLRNPKK